MRSLAFPATVLLLLSCSLSCSLRSGSPGNSLRIQLSADPITLDPSLAEDGNAFRVLANSMDGLVGYNGAGQLEPRLAESYEVSPDRKQYVFKLRENARWSDGKNVKAEDFVTALDRARRPEIGSKWIEMLRPMRRAFERDGKLVIELNRSAPYFIQALTLPVAYPLRRDILPDILKAGGWPDRAPSTGPYWIRERRLGEVISLQKNPHYWKDLKRAPEQVEFRIVLDESTAVSLFEQGRLDIVSRISAYDLSRLRQKTNVRTEPMAATYYLSFNVRKPPFNELRWRRAVSSAIRREELVAALPTGEALATGWIPPGIEGHASFRVHHPESEKWVASSTGNARNKSVSAGFDSGGRNTLVMEKVQQDLSKRLGLQVSLQHSDWKTYVRGLASNPPQIFRFAWLAPFKDPIPHLQAFTTGNPNNYSGWSNAEYDHLVDEISRMEVGPQREAKVRWAQKVLIEDEAILVPLYHYAQTHAVSSRVNDFRANLFGIIRADELRVLSSP